MLISVRTSTSINCYFPLFLGDEDLGEDLLEVVYKFNSSDDDTLILRHKHLEVVVGGSVRVLVESFTCARRLRGELGGSRYCLENCRGFSPHE